MYFIKKVTEKSKNYCNNKERKISVYILDTHDKK